MGRPKGSKNKEKAETRPVVTPPPAKTWKPGPDMGEVKPPTPEVKPCSSCGHLKGLHYGSAKEWCNNKGCNCQAWQA